MHKATRRFRITQAHTSDLLLSGNKKKGINQIKPLAKWPWRSISKPT
jgi:hypothetical protein